MSSNSSNTGSSASSTFNEARGQLENLRQGINKTADDAIQPSAARDTERGVTSRHNESSAGHTTSSSTSGGSGFSADAKALGKGIMDAAKDAKDSSSSGGSSTTGTGRTL